MSHLGVPLWSIVIPAIVWSTSPEGSFARAHARQAFSFQLVYLPVGLLSTGLMIWHGPKPLLLCILVGVVLEAPQVVRALRGVPPFRLVPFDVLAA